MILHRNSLLLVGAFLLVAGATILAPQGAHATAGVCSATWQTNTTGATSVAGLASYPSSGSTAEQQANKASCLSSCQQAGATYGNSNYLCVFNASSYGTTNGYMWIVVYAGESCSYYLPPSQAAGDFGNNAVGPGCGMPSSCSSNWSNTWASSCTYTATVAAPTATISATPNPIDPGGSSTLTWKSTNATSCTGTNFVTNNATSGTVSTGSLNASKTYSVTCSNSAGATATASVTAKVNPTLTGSCSVLPTSITTGGSATWSATASGGTGVYTYAWSAPGGSPSTGSNSTLNATYSTAGTKTAGVTITSGSQTKPITCSNSLSVTDAPQPDLTAGNTGPATATAGTPVSLVSTITNGGAATTGAGFYTLFQRATDSSGTNATDLGTYQRTTALVNGSSFSASFSYIFPSAGTWYLRACADKSSAGDAGTIAESNEGNNCSPGWTVINVCSSGYAWNGSSCISTTPPPTCSLSANPANSVPSTLTWSSTNSTSCTGGGTGFSTSNATSGSATVNALGTYTLSCSGAGGSCSTSAIIGSACGISSPTIAATPDRVRAGGTTHITWSAPSGVDTSCVVTENGTTIASPAGSSCRIPDGSADRTISTQTIYKISCDNGEKIAQVVVNLTPQFQEF